MPIFDNKNFNEWQTLNDTIMGGNSTAKCSPSKDGLCLEGDVVENDGGFISCRSPVIDPPLNLSSFTGIEIKIEAKGRRLKIALSTNDKFTGLTELFSGGLKWISEFKTNPTGITSVRIPFQTLEPSIRAKPVQLPLAFNSSFINQFQLLYSKFGVSGQPNPEFQPGAFKIFLESLSAYK